MTAGFVQSQEPNARYYKSGGHRPPLQGINTSRPMYMGGGLGSITQLHRRHQTTVRVIQNMAVNHPGTGAIFKTHEQFQRFVERHIYRVLPFYWANRLTVLI